MRRAWPLLLLLLSGCYYDTLPRGRLPWDAGAPPPASTPDAGQPVDLRPSMDGGWIGTVEDLAYRVNQYPQPPTIIYDRTSTSSFEVLSVDDAGFAVVRADFGCVDDGGIPIQLLLDGGVLVGSHVCAIGSCAVPTGGTGQGGWLVDGGSGSWIPGSLRLQLHEQYSSSCYPDNVWDDFSFSADR